MAFNGRLFFWLIKAYLKRWGRLFLIYFVFGLTAFFLLIYLVTTFAPKLPLVHNTTIGIVGNVTQDSLPDVVLQQLSRGFTKLAQDGSPLPDVAVNWSMSNDGKTYTLHLQKGLYFSDGTPVTSSQIAIPFSDIQVQTPNDNTIVFTLKETYAPFLTKLSTPIFRKDKTFIGISTTQIKDFTLNGTFVSKVTLASSQDPYTLTTYSFYPTQEALKLALVLGDVDQAAGITDLSFKNGSFTQFPNLTTQKQTDYTQLVTLFFNTQDRFLSDKRLREALTLTLPDSFVAGESATGPYPPSSWAYSLINPQTRDIDKGLKLFSEASGSQADLTLTTTPQYSQLGQTLVDYWGKLNIHVKLETTNTLPDSFQMYLGDFRVPRDPDQYTLWHSNEDNNITRYNSPRIDLLLENGRSKTTDETERKKYYTDFQKYLTDDPPAAFLYFPFSYTITRK